MEANDDVKESLCEPIARVYRPFCQGAYHSFGGAPANKFGLLDQVPEHGTHPFCQV